MAIRTAPRTTATDAPPLLDRALLAAVGRAGTPTELRFRLGRVCLGDGASQTLTAPVTVRILWDGEYFLAKDNRTNIWGLGDTPVQALDDYLGAWAEEVAGLERDGRSWERH